MDGQEGEGNDGGEGSEVMALVAEGRVGHHGDGGGDEDEGPLDETRGLDVDEKPGEEEQVDEDGDEEDAHECDVVLEHSGGDGVEQGALGSVLRYDAESGFVAECVGDKTMERGWIEEIEDDGDDSDEDCCDDGDAGELFECEGERVGFVVEAQKDLKRDPCCGEDANIWMRKEGQCDQEAAEWRVELLTTSG